MAQEEPYNPFTVLRRSGGLAAKMHDILENIRELGLESNAVELETLGYTVVPPEKVASADFLDRIRSALLAAVERRTGVPHRLDQEADAGRLLDEGFRGGESMKVARNQFGLSLLLEDPVFQEWLENPVMMALLDYVMRGSARLSAMSAQVKSKGASFASLGLHSDATMSSPEGLLTSTHDIVCNGTLILTDYSKENGALAVVPASHLLCRQPNGEEGVEDAIPIEAPAGSLIFWRGNLWHGAFPKQTGGLRLNIISYFCTPQLRTATQFEGNVPQEVLDRRSTRFALLVGALGPHA